MTVSGIPAAPQGIVPARPEPRDTSVARGQTPAPSGTAPAAAPPAKHHHTGRAHDGAIPVAAPPGTDPDLWSVLTTAERDFFARSATQGPLTYSKVMSPNRTPTPPAPTARGGRVDVRV